MPTNWPMAGSVAPPFACSDVQTAIDFVRVSKDFEQVAATAQETTAFGAVRCDLGHTVTGFVFRRKGTTSPRYWVAACNTPHVAGQGKSRALFFPWAPFYVSTYQPGE